MVFININLAFLDFLEIVHTSFVFYAYLRNKRLEFYGLQLDTVLLEISFMFLRFCALTEKMRTLAFCFLLHMLLGFDTGNHSEFLFARLLLCYRIFTASFIHFTACILVIKISEIGMYFVFDSYALWSTER